MPRYASNTSVSVDKSKAEIERNLMRYGADAFRYQVSQDKAQISFVYEARSFQFDLPLPDQEDDEFRRTPGGRRRRSIEDAYKHWEQACRQRWRALKLYIHALLEAVECGIISFEEAFLAQTVLPAGGTVGAVALKQMNNCMALGDPLKLLPAPKKGG